MAIERDLSNILNSEDIKKNIGNTERKQTICND